MRRVKLGTQLNISFALVLFVPMVVATVFSIVYYSHKIRQEAVNTISSDLKIAQIIYGHAVDQMSHLADAYAQKKTLTVLLGLNMGRKLGDDLARSAALDAIDMVTVVDREYAVLVRSHAPGKIEESFARKKFVDTALSGVSLSGTEVLDRNALEQEGFSPDEEDQIPEEVLAITGIAPVYDRGREKIVAAVVVRRLVGGRSEIIRNICRHLNVHAALFEGTRLVASCAANQAQGAFTPPKREILTEVLETDAPLHAARIREGGSISKFQPIHDFDGHPVGVLMVQSDVGPYIRTRNTAILTLLAIFLTGVLLAVLVKTIIVRKIVLRLQRLREQTERISQGEYGHAVAVTSGDEIGELTAAFNTMSEDLQAYDWKLKEYNQQLEARVRERTAELEEANERLVRANTVLEDTLESLNPGVSRLIGSNKQQLGLVYASELVADICNYTKLNMILGETMMGEFMKKFFRESHKLLAEYRGMFDKTVGDQIVAIFGTPKDYSPASPIHSFDAIACAMKLVEAARNINRLMQEAIQDNYTAVASRHNSLSSEDRKSIRIEDLAFQCRVGINTSNPASPREIDRMRMVMMGAETCVDYTAQGGAVIYAFRLESNGTPGEIHIGENTKRLVEHVYVLEERPPITLKGLGMQPGYRVNGLQSPFENIYPKTRFYREYAGNVPPLVTDLMGRLRMGRIQIREVRKINEYLEIDIPYLEHMAGFYNLCVSRALLAYAAARLWGIEGERLDALVLASLWRNAEVLSELALDAMEPYHIGDQTPESVDPDLAASLVEDLRTRVKSFPEAGVIALCDQFDGLVFDRTYLRSRGQEVISAKEAISLMRIEGTYPAEMLGTLETLMIAPEEVPEVPEEGPRIPAFPGDPEQIARSLKKHLTEEQVAALIQRLRALPEEEGGGRGGEEGDGNGPVSV